MAFLARHRLAGLAALLVAVFPFYALAQDGVQLAEQKIKAGLLYNFLKYTQWPTDEKSSTTPMNVCVFGEDPFEGSLHAMAERTVNQRSIMLRFVESIPEIDECNLLYINPKEKQRWPNLKEFLRGKSVLTVSDFEGFVSSGGMIEFTNINRRISAILNPQAVTAAKLVIEPRLLKLVNIARAPQATSKP